MERQCAAASGTFPGRMLECVSSTSISARPAEMTQMQTQCRELVVSMCWQPRGHRGLRGGAFPHQPGLLVFGPYAAESKSNRVSFKLVLFWVSTFLQSDTSKSGLAFCFLLFLVYELSCISQNMSNEHSPLTTKSRSYLIENKKSSSSSGPFSQPENKYYLDRIFQLLSVPLPAF